MKSPAVARRIIDAIARHYPDADTELHYKTPFELLVATMLSAQSTDARVNLVTPALFARFPDAAVAVEGRRARARGDDSSHRIFPPEVARAHRHVHRARSTTMAESVPASMEALTKLPGVGRKTANVVLGHALGVPGLPVDRHVLRVTNRLGLVRSDDPVKVEAALTKMVPPARWTKTSDSFILHGRRICRPTPLCPRCNARKDCDFALSGDDDERWPRAGEPKPVARAARKAGPAMSRDEFKALVEEAIDTIPRRFARHVRNLAVVIEDEPSEALLRELEMDPADTLLGLYQGTPLTERGAGYGNQLPDLITLFQGPIEEAGEGDEDAIVGEIGETLIHELGHYFGMSEDEIMAIEDRYWRGEPERPGDARRRRG